MKRKLFMLSVALLTSITMMAVPAKRGLTRMITLSDGSTVEAKLVGDEFGHFWLADNGQAYVKTTGVNFFTEVNAASIMVQAQSRRSEVNAQRIQRLPGIKSHGANRRVGEYGDYTGAKKALVILVNFSDVQFAEAHDNALYQRIANEVGFNEGNFVGSMYDYFYAQSEGKFELTFDVLGPVTVSNTQSYYGSNDFEGNDLNPEEMVKEAVEQIKDQVTDWRQYDWDSDGYVDQVYVIYAGNGEADGGADTTIWPHAWSLSYSGIGAVTVGENLKVDSYACGSELDGSNKIDGIGTMCHEFSHCLGYPDFYDTDYSGGQGMSDWDLMDSGSYNGDGYCPAGYTGYERWMAGWKEPIELNMGEASIENMKGLQDGGEFYIMYNDGHTNEYYMLENRTKSGWDKALPGSGLLIIHVDYDATIWAWNQPNDDPNHQRMTWIPSDGSYNFTGYGGNKYPTGLSKDPYPNATSGNNTFDDTSSPAANLYNNNTDGTKLLHKGIKDITKNSDGTISFNYVGPIIPKLKPDLSWSISSVIVFPNDEFLAPTLSNPNNLTVIYLSSNTDVATIDATTGEVMLTGNEGATIINAVFEGDDDYEAGMASFSLMVCRYDPQLYFEESATATKVNDKNFKNPALINVENLPVTYESSYPEVASVNAKTGDITIGKAGSAMIVAIFEGNAMYAPENAYYEIIVEKYEHGLSFEESEVEATVGLKTFHGPKLNNPNNLKVTYTSSDEQIATVDEQGNVFLGATAGIVTITAAFAGNDNYEAGEASYQIILSEATGISTLSHDQQDIDAYYTIQGVRVNKPYKGLYILNGKKVMIK